MFEWRKRQKKKISGECEIFVQKFFDCFTWNVVLGLFF